MNKSIVVIGSSNTDMVVKSDRFPESGETILGGDFYMLPGGKGANQAVAAARLGGNVNFMCRVGEDLFGRRAIEGYKKEDISTENVIVDSERPSGVAIITVNGSGENKIVVAPGANNGFTNKEIEEGYDLIANAKIVVIQLEIPIQTVGKIIESANKNETYVILNPAPAQPLPTWFYEDLYLITPNETETESLTGIELKDDQTKIEAAEWFQKRGVNNIVITMGDRGSFLVTENYTGHISAPDVKAVDTTAAGDVFNGALSVSLAKEKTLKEAVEFANKAAALSVKKIGAQSSCPTSEEINDFESIINY